MVGGRIVAIPVTENALVSRGDLLFQIDPVPHQLTTAQAEADLEIAEAALDTQRRLVVTQQSNATIASDQTRRAQTNYDLATRTVERLQPLAAKGFVPAQQLDQAEVSQRDAATSLLQAQEQEAAAFKAIDTIAGQEANVRARTAALAIARRTLDDTTVKASSNGSVVGLTVSPGEIVAPSQPLFTLINTDEWFAVANFRETALHAITIGECATVYSMIDRHQSIKGAVTSIGRRRFGLRQGQFAAVRSLCGAVVELGPGRTAVSCTYQARPPPGIFGQSGCQRSRRGRVWRTMQMTVPGAMPGIYFVYWPHSRDASNFQFNWP